MIIIVFCFCFFQNEKIYKLFQTYNSVNISSNGTGEIFQSFSLKVDSIGESQ